MTVVNVIYIITESNDDTNFLIKNSYILTKDDDESVYDALPFFIKVDNTKKYLKKYE